jgi:putative Ca2+/H+ antiporter (TMEM165/GDT1 family)
VHFGAWFKMRKPTDFRPVFVFLGVLCGGAKMALQRLCKTGHAARRVFLKNRAKTATQSHFLHFAMLLKSALQHNKASRSRDGILPLFGAANFYFNRTFASD